MSQKQGFVYKLTCNQSGDVYVGSTEDMERRMDRHKSDCEKWVYGKGPWVSSYPIILTDDYKEEVLEVVELKGDTPEARRDELRRREQYWLDVYRNLPETKDHVLNECDAHSGFDSREEYIKAYREKNRDRLSAQKREYYERNKDKIKANTRKYHNKNRDRILVQMREYRERNKDKINAQHREWYEKNRDTYNAKRRQKITCECGDVVTRGGIARHIQTQRHADRLQEQTQQRIDDLDRFSFTDSCSSSPSSSD